MFKISDKGKGPDEYIFIQNFFIDSFNNQIKVLSGDGKIISYSPVNGSHISTKANNNGFVMFMDGVQLSKESEALYTLGPKFNMVITEQNKPDKNLIPFIEQRDMGFSDKAFSIYKNSILFCHGTNDSIYTISSSGNKIKAGYYIDFKQNKIDPNLYLSSPAMVENRFKEQTIATKLDNLSEADDYLSFSYLLFNPNNAMAVQKQFVIYSKSSQTALNIKGDCYLLPIQDIASGNIFVSLVSPIQIMNPKNNYFKEEKLMQFIENKNIPEDSNPLVILWRIK